MFRDREGWRVQWTDRGRRRSKKFETKAEARRYEMELELGVADKTAQGLSPTFAEYAADWVESYCKVEKAESQWKSDERAIRLHLLPLLGPVRLTALRRSHLLAVKDQLRAKTAVGKTHRLSPKTVNLALALAKKIMATAAEREIVPSNPFLGVKLVRLGPQRFRYWTGAERETFLRHADREDPEFGRLVRVACHTGLRLGELAALTRADLDFERAKVRVSKTWDVTLAKVLPMTKGRTDEDVPMNRDVLEALGPKRFLQPGAAVFDRSLFWSARKRLGRLAVKAGVAPIRFHDLRHTFASTLAMAGMDLMSIQQLCRHKSYQMTLRYAHLHPEHLRGATDALCTRPAHGLDAKAKSGGSTRT